MSAERAERQTWMDLLRGIAVLLVVSWHSVSVLDGIGVDVPESVGVVNQALSPFRLPALLVISGMLLPRSLAKPPLTYVAGKCRAILWPFLVWTVIMALLRDPSSLADPVTWIAGRDHLWFLSTLMVCYVAALALRRVPGWAVAGVVWAAWFVLTPQVPGVANWMWFGAYFFLGSSIVAVTDRISRLPRAAVAGLVVVSVAGAVLAAARNGYQWSAPWLVISVAGVVLLIWAVPRVPRSLPVRGLEALGRSSIYYYLAHVAAIVIVGRGLTRVGIESGWAIYAVAMMAGLLLPLALTRIPAARILFRWPGREQRREQFEPDGRETDLPGAVGWLRTRGAQFRRE